MVEMALEQLATSGIVELDAERKAAMVSQPAGRALRRAATAAGRQRRQLYQLSEPSWRAQALPAADRPGGLESLQRWAADELRSAQRADRVPPSPAPCGTPAARRRGNGGRGASRAAGPADPRNVLGSGRLRAAGPSLPQPPLSRPPPRPPGERGLQQEASAFAFRLTTPSSPVGKGGRPGEEGRGDEGPRTARHPILLSTQESRHKKGGEPLPALASQPLKLAALHPAAPQHQQGAAHQQQRQGHQAELREGRDLAANRRHPEGGRIVRPPRCDGSSVRLDDSLVPLPSASKETVPWLEIVWPAVPVLIGGRDGDRHRAAGGDPSRSRCTVLGHVGRGRAGGGAGGDQRQAGRQDVGELVARVVELGVGARVGDHHRVGHRAALGEVPETVLVLGADRRRRDHHGSLAVPPPGSSVRRRLRWCRCRWRRRRRCPGW